MANAQNQLATSFQLDLVSPEKILSSEPVRFAIVPASEGAIGVLPGHSPVLTAMAPGLLEMHPANGNAVRRIFIAGGFLDITPTSCTALAVKATPFEEMNEAQLRQSYEAAQTNLARAGTEQERKALSDQVDVLKAQIESVTGRPLV